MICYTKPDQVSTQVVLTRQILHGPTQGSLSRRYGSLPCLSTEDSASSQLTYTSPRKEGAALYKEITGLQSILVLISEPVRLRQFPYVLQYLLHGL